MDRIEKIHELIDEIGRLLQEECPEHTRAEVTVRPDGYAELDVTEWETSDIPIEERKYRYLLRQIRFPKEADWSGDVGGEINDFLARDNQLLRRA